MKEKRYENFFLIFKPFYKIFIGGIIEKSVEKTLVIEYTKH